MGHGPWSWSGIAPMAFFDNGLLLTPWGTGTYSPVPNSADAALTVVFAGANHHVVMGDCHTFSSVRQSDGERVEGWVQVAPRAQNCYTA